MENMSPTLVCLHGWGGSSESFSELRSALKGADVKILAPDLPGFGEEPEPKKAWTTDHYAGWTEAWIKHHVKGPFFLLGHSHGGRIAIKLAATRGLPIDGIFLCAAAGIRHPRHFKRIVGLTLAKAGKTLLSIPFLRKLQPIGKKLLYRLVRVHDYEKASRVMQQTLILVSAENLRHLLPDVRVPTDIFWGKQDGMTPFSDALLMENLIPNAVLHAYEGVRHAVHRDRATEIAEVIRARMAV
jgi:pimeloyl-ACP methyl ester carboxylesterase